MIFCERTVLRVLVADDHELTRYSLKLALKAQEGIELVGLATDGQERSPSSSAMSRMW